MLQYQTIESKTLKILKELCNEDFLKNCRLVGGTALALQYGHRISVDLDFTGIIEDDTTELRNTPFIKDSIDNF